jgi:hypothetical protein
MESLHGMTATRSHNLHKEEDTIIPDSSMKRSWMKT